MTASNPKVTVIIPTYNRGHLIQEAIKSVLSQKAPFEIVIVDDGSTDNTAEIVHSFQDNRIRYLTLKEKGGAQIARNVGIMEAKSELIAFLDSDDIMLPESLPDRLDYFENNPHCESSYSDYQVCFIGLYHNYTKKIKIGQINPDDVYRKSLKTLSLAPTSVFMARRETFRDVGEMDINLPASHDNDIFLRFSKRGTCHYIPLYAACLIQHTGESVCRNPVRFAQGRAMLIEKFKNDILAEFGYRTLQRHYVSNAIDFWVAGKTHEAKEALKKAGNLGGVSLLLALPVMIIKRIVYFTARLLRKKLLRLL